MDVKFTIDPDAILFDRRLSSTEYRVMLLLINRASRSFMGIEGRFKCLISDMAMMIGLSEHTVKLSIKTLERLNYIKIEKDGLSNVYSIRWDTIEAMDRGECDGTAIVKKTKIETPKAKIETPKKTTARLEIKDITPECIPGRLTIELRELYRTKESSLSTCTKNWVEKRHRKYV